MPRADQTQSDRDLIADRELLERLEEYPDQIATTDPTAYHLEISGRSPGELADHLSVVIGARADQESVA